MIKIIIKIAVRAAYDWGCYMIADTRELAATLRDLSREHERDHDVPDTSPATPPPPRPPLACVVAGCDQPCELAYCPAHLTTAIAQPVSFARCCPGCGWTWFTPEPIVCPTLGCTGLADAA